jgi:tRNA nucleotidyltransferase (CCA-adding enzyme)
LEVLPRAVVTASDARRLTLATEAGPVDLLPVGRGALERVLLAFGLSPFAFAYRPTEEHWCDPADARATFDAGVLDLSVATPNPFDLAPRRYWIAARLLSERALEPSPDLLEAARAALPGVIDRLPQAAPARREVSRILASSAPERGLAFLRKSGVSPALFPGMDPAGEASIAQLAPLPALRWAAWLQGSAIQSALVRLRVPPPLARRIERIHRTHPIDRRVESLREVGVRKILGRLGQDEIDGLFVWRRLEIAAAPASEETRIRSTQLDELEARFEEVRSHQERSGHIRALALDGKTVMTALGAGPGPHVGRALAHLANFVEAQPDANERKALERELSDWAAKNADSIG